MTIIKPRRWYRWGPLHWYWYNDTTTGWNIRRDRLGGYRGDGRLFAIVGRVGV